MILLLDWSIFLAEKNIAKEVVLVHRSSSFRGHLDSVQKVIDMAGDGRISLVTEAEVTGITGNGKVEGVVITHQKMVKSCVKPIILFLCLD